MDTGIAPAPVAPAPPSIVTNGKAVTAMILGILWIYWIGSILALIFGYVARKEIKRAGGYQSGMGMAIAGIVLGWIGIGSMLLIIIFT
ncbi:MAG: uncharacterized protein JWM90_191 [Thermoleophilia bacterium]|nr:uncharacterized protein [Thermoleophilia bacterium]